MAIDHEPSARGRIQLGAVDRPDDRLLAVHVLEDPWRDETAALDRLPDLAVLLDEGDIVSGLRDLAREVPAGRARAAPAAVAGACRRDRVRGSPLQSQDDL